jgi:hypothetical protein
LGAASEAGIGRGGCIRFCGGSGSDFAEEPAVQGVEPVTLAMSRSLVSSRVPYGASRRSWR